MRLWKREKQKKKKEKKEEVVHGAVSRGLRTNFSNLLWLQLSLCEPLFVYIQSKKQNQKILSIQLNLLGAIRCS